MEQKRQAGSGRAGAVRREVGRMLEQIPAYKELNPTTQRALNESLSKVASYLTQSAALSPRGPLSRQLAPDLRSALAPGGGQTPRPSGGPAAGGVAEPGGAAAPAAGGAGGGGTVGRVGEVARATLNAIDFPGFVSGLIQGTFQAIVDASVQQMEAYAELVQNIARTTDEFMQDHISDGMARDYLADRFDGFLARDTQGPQPMLSVHPEALAGDELPSFFKDLGFSSPSDVDETALEEVVIPATRQTLAEQRQQLLATMVLMGINRVVVDDGEISAKLQFHVDASEAMEMRFDQTKTTVGNVASRAGRSPFSANGILVNTTSLNAQSDINVRSDLTGQVKVRFRSETFPLERFADSAAIQLINTKAHVPQANLAEAGQSEAAGAGGSGGSSTAAPSGERNDPWTPR